MLVRSQGNLGTGCTVKTWPALGQTALKRMPATPPGRGSDIGSTEGKRGGNVSCAGGRRAFPAERFCAGDPYPLKCVICHICH